MLCQDTRDEHVVFLWDTRQSWYHAAEGWEAMMAWLLDYQALAGRIRELRRGPRSHGRTGGNATRLSPQPDRMTIRRAEPP
ncbi:hypothetical protein SAMN02927895_02790 [Belnapia rosea]|uniref:Uncharacterized protein n=1 Tax=Belnapia rosea TaxID=938405 RepID=A0A1G6QE82_9PROT|nr:hypothetical protein SAMN02927895_02790 [Belnapia rosea]SDC90802.1 hypothetical protein SAMN04487779_100314 [Belnapia rosea]